MTDSPGWRRWLNPALADLSAYTPAPGEFEVRLDANEAPSLLSKEAQEQLALRAARIDWRRYPDAGSTRLRDAIAQRCGVAPEEVLLGVGSDELIAMLLRAFGRDGKSGGGVLTLTPTFVMYRMTARIHGHQVMEVPLDANWGMNPDAVSKALEMFQPSLIFVASPNNPTGTMVDMDHLRRLVESAPESVVVVDEAYVDYASRHQLALFRDHENVVILRTLSKVGFAALRLGWMLGRREIVREIDKVRLPYNLPVPTQELATLVVTELGDELTRIRDSVVNERERVAAGLARFAGISVTPSEANFLWIKTETSAEEVYEGLKAQSVLVRSFHKHGGRLKHYLRVTIGLEHENERFLSALAEVV